MHDNDIESMCLIQTQAHTHTHTHTNTHTHTHAHTHTDESDSPQSHTNSKEKKLKSWRLTTVCVVYLGYMGIMVNRSSLDTLNHAMKNDETLTEWTYMTSGRVYSVGNISYILGKIISSQIISMMGAKLAFFFSAAAVAACNICFSFTHRIHIFTLVWVLCRTFLAVAWPALVKIVCQWCPPHMLGRVFAILSTSSRVAAFLCSLFLGELLIMGWHWRTLFAMCGFLLIGFVIFFRPFMLESPAELEAESRDIELKERKQFTHLQETHSLPQTHTFKDNAGGPDTIAAVRRFSREQHFWLMVISIMCLTPITEMNTWWPSFFSDHMKLTEGISSTLSSAFPAGFITGVLMCGCVYDKLHMRAKFFVMTCLLVLETLAVCVALTLVSDVYTQVHNTHTHTVGITLWIFVMGFAVGPPFYIPVGVYCAMFGGKTHCGTMSALLDAFGYVSTSVITAVIGVKAHHSEWVSVFAILFILSFFATLTFSYFMFINIDKQYV